MTTANAAVANEIAKNLIAILKSGGLFKGTVRSLVADGATNIAWIAIDLPEVGERQVAVRCEQNLQLGQAVVVECVPDPQRPGHYMFKMAESNAALNWLM